MGIPQIDILFIKSLISHRRPDFCFFEIEMRKRFVENQQAMVCRRTQFFFIAIGAAKSWLTVFLKLIDCSISQSLSLHKGSVLLSLLDITQHIHICCEMRVSASENKLPETYQHKVLNKSCNCRIRSLAHRYFQHCSYSQAFAHIGYVLYCSFQPVNKQAKKAHFMPFVFRL